jgi:NAD(P)-dependent dehydrogenase (short-subunit alcohol dehydrogenase family)
MDLKISSRTALVTASTSGIGYAIAESLSREGAAVIVNGRTEDSVATAVKNLKTKNPGAAIQGVAADVGTPAGADKVVAEFPSVDILVNNLGVYTRQDFFQTSDEDWRNYFEVNVLSGIRLARLYSPGMVKRAWGRIIFISSDAGLLIPVELLAYGVSKTAQIAASRGLATALAGTGVTVNSVLPGPTRTDGISEMLRKDEQRTGKSASTLESEFFTITRPNSLIRRYAEPEEVANIVTYLAGSGSSCTTGAALRVDGGIVSSLG